MDQSLSQSQIILRATCFGGLDAPGSAAMRFTPGEELVMSDMTRMNRI